MIRVAITDAEELLDLLLDQPWHNDCEIIPNYMPPYPQPDTKPKMVVRYIPYNSFLRYSLGPKQGFLWDVYGDDMQSIALAVLALHEAPAPVDTRPITFTFPLKKKEVKDK